MGRGPRLLSLGHPWWGGSSGGCGFDLAFSSQVPVCYENAGDVRPEIVLDGRVLSIRISDVS